MKDLKLGSGTALVVAAHPDDETIWMGGTILRNPGIGWTIFSLCRGDDTDRAPKFRKACEKYGARAIISDLEDDGIMDVETSIPEIKKLIRQNLFGKNLFDYLFTHGKNGEYGHPRHIGAYLAVKDLLAEKFLSAGKAFCFAYREGADGAAVPGENADFSVKLTEKEYEEKKRIIKDVYGFNEASFEYKSCSKTETFNILKFSSI